MTSHLGLKALIFDEPITGLPRQSLLRRQQQLFDDERIERQLQCQPLIDRRLVVRPRAAAFVVQHVKHNFARYASHIDAVDAPTQLDRFPVVLELIGLRTAKRIAGHAVRIGRFRIVGFDILWTKRRFKVGRSNRLIALAGALVAWVMALAARTIVAALW